MQFCSEHSFFVLEYTFKNSHREQVHTILLNDYNMTVRSGQVEAVVPYANITNVRLCRVSKGLFKMIISYNNRSLIVTNQFISNTGAVQNNARLYSTFVRVLHFHLKDKSKAHYKTGCSREKLWKSAVIAILASFMVCFVSEYLGFHIINPYLDGSILSAFFIGVLYALQIGRLPKDYSATNIPFQLLPAA